MLQFCIEYADTDTHIYTHSKWPSTVHHTYATVRLVMTTTSPQGYWIAVTTASLFFPQFTEYWTISLWLYCSFTTEHSLQILPHALKYLLFWVVHANSLKLQQSRRNRKNFKCKGNDEDRSVQGATAANGVAVARNLVVLEREFVVVRNFLVDVDVSSRVDDDLFLRFDRHYLCTAVRLRHATTARHTGPVKN